MTYRAYRALFEGAAVGPRAPVPAGRRGPNGILHALTRAARALVHAATPAIETRTPDTVR